MSNGPYDLAIIGSGGSAFSAAIAARERDLTVVMIESGTVGGTCVNTGCVPSKALLAAAEARHAAGGRRFAGVATQAARVDLAALVGAKRDLVETMRADKYVDLAAEHGWRLVRGFARFGGDADEPILEVDPGTSAAVRVEASHYLIATGAVPSVPPIDGLEKAGYLTSTTAMELTRLPTSMVVVGGNAVGLEQAQLFARLGVDVTVVEASDRLAPYDEPELSHVLADILGGEGITVVTGAVVNAVDRDQDGCHVRIEASGDAEKEMLTDHLLVATGRRPATDGIGLDRVGVRVNDRGAVVVDEYQRTTNPRVWAAGDVTGGPQFVYVAAAHGTTVVENAFAGAGRILDYAHLPRVTFTSPAIAGVGMTEAEAIATGLRVDVRVLSLDRVPRAIVNRQPQGVVKMVADKSTGRVVGVSMLADGAGDAILAAVYAVKAGMTVRDIVDTWTPYLTMAEGVRLAAQAFTRDVTRLSCCAS